LWAYFKGPPAQNSIAIYNDGTVVEKATFDTSELRPEKGVKTFILGGTDFRVFDTDPDYLTLVDAGYEFRALSGQGMNSTNSYGDIYDDNYVREWGQQPDVNAAMLKKNRDEIEARRLAEVRRQRDARIATLEAELAAMKGQS
jgi:hypothetical protein